MPLPAGLSPLRGKVRFNAAPSVVTVYSENGSPYIREMFVADPYGKVEISAPYLMTDAQLASTEADFESTPAAFAWDDERFSPAQTRQVKYAGPPVSRKTIDGQPLPAGINYVVVPLIEV